MPKRAWIGLGLMLAGACICGGWSAWMATRTWVPLDMPLSLGRGHVRSPEFKINVDAGFWVYIEVGTKPDPDGVACLVGYASDYCRKNNVRELRASWTLSDSGRVVARGSTDTYTGVRGGMLSKARGLGEFVVPKGDHYVLDVDLRDDNGVFNAGHPSLIAENYYWGYEEQRAPIFFFATFLAAIGAALLVSAICEPLIKRRNEVISLKTAAPVAVNAPSNAQAIAGDSTPSVGGQPSFWIGIALFVAGLGTFIAVGSWYASRIFMPVNKPVSLSAGHIHTGPFRTNVEGEYSIWIDFTRGRMDPMCSSYSSLRTRWVLYRDGQVTERWDSPILQDAYLEGFSATKGSYDLDIEVLPGGECLNAQNPRLKVVTGRADYEFLTALLQWPSVLCAVVGLSLVILARAARQDQESSAFVRLDVLPSVGQSFQFAQRMPLRRPISGLPGFGILGGMTFALLAVLMMLLTFGFQRISTGLPVHVLKPGQVPEKSDAWTEPIIVWLKDAGVGERPQVYVNSKPVAWDDLDRALKEELGRRKDWVVFVGGEDMVAYSNVTDVIEAARKCRAKVFLATKK